MYIWMAWVRSLATGEVSGMPYPLDRRPNTSTRSQGRR